MTRPLKPGERQHLAELLHTLAEELTRTPTNDTMRLIGEAADNNYPTRASTVPAQPHNRTDTDGTPIPPDTPTEAKALSHDRPGTEAQQLLNDIWNLNNDTGSILQRLWAWRSDRAIKACERCGHPLQRGRTRCQQIIDNRQCGASERGLRVCDICADPVPPGTPLRQYQGDGIFRCPKDWIHRQRHGHDRNNLERLQLDNSVLISDQGTAHTNVLPNT